MAGSVCVQCGAAVPAVLVRTGSRQRVAHCKACGRTCDEYFEADGGLVLLDLLLHRPPAYRHVMRNLVAHASAEERHGALLALGASQVLCDAYLRWQRDGEVSAAALPVAALEFGVFVLAAAAAGGDHWRPVATATLISSVVKGAVLLHMIWEYPPAFGRAIELFALTCNVVALTELLRCTTRRATAVVACAAAARACVWPAIRIGRLLLE